MFKGINVPVRRVHSLCSCPLGACSFALAQSWEVEMGPQTPLQTAEPPA